MRTTQIDLFPTEFSSVFDLITNENAPNPTADLPLGVPFPGDTWTDGEKPNWVSHGIEEGDAQLPSLLSFDL